MLALYTRELLPFVVLFSLIIGAYCTTAEYRIRSGMPLVTKDCFCPFCGHKLSVFHQIPVVSWLFLRGKCHDCRHPIPARYPLTEAAFPLFYTVVFLALRSRPACYVTAWLLFTTLFLCLRTKGQGRGLLRGLLILYSYHFLFAAVLWMIGQALRSPMP